MRTLLLLTVLVAGVAQAEAQAPSPTLTPDQQKDLRIVEQEAEKALLALQLAEARFVIAREAMAKHLTTLQRPGYRLDKAEGGWRYLPAEGQ